MNGRIGIFFRLFAIALTITGIAADGETTPAVAAEVAATSGPEAAANSGPPIGALPIQLDAVEREDNSDDSDGFKCYEYFCGPHTPVKVDKVNNIIENIMDVPCEDKPQKSVPCKDKFCSRATTKGVMNGKKVDVISGRCFEKSPEIHPKNGCFDDKDVCGAKCGLDKLNITGDFESCLCSTALCNGPSATFPSDKSSVSSPTAFVTIAALAIVVKINIF